MPRSTSAAQSNCRALHITPSRLSFAGKAAAVLLATLMTLAAASEALALMPKKHRRSPSVPVEPSAEARRVLTRLASVSTFRGLTPKETCKGRRTSEKPAPGQCWLVFGKTSVMVRWHGPLGHVSSVSLRTSIPDGEQTAYRSAPLRWVDFAEVHRILCPQRSDVASLMASLPQHLSQASWGGLGTMRHVVVEDLPGCRAVLVESRDDTYPGPGISLSYDINPSRRP
jgi:hypothetical protein